jgi:hypothetical protein
LDESAFKGFAELKDYGVLGFLRRSKIPAVSRNFQGFLGVSRGFQGFPGVSRGIPGLVRYRSARGSRGARGLGFRVWGLGFGVWGLGRRV